MFEKPNNAPAEQEGSVEKPGGFIESLAERYRTEGVPIGNDGRIDMKEYLPLYSSLVVNQDLRRNEEWEQQWQQKGEAINRRETDGEKLEMLAYAIFAKNLAEKFIVARSSPHDDRANKVDTLLLDRQTGNLVCAFDEVGDTSGVDYERKQATIQEHNLKGGAEIRYGIEMIEKDKKKAVGLTAAYNVPLFYIALPKDRIEKGIKEFLPDEKQQSDFEQKLFAYFMATLSAQAKGLELYSNRLNPHLKTKLTAFKKVLSDLSLKQEKKK